jgi:hypothetical protein
MTFLLGIATTLITVYYLAIQNIPALLNVFPHFSLFAVISIAAGVPLSCSIGWYHLTGTALWQSELDITVEANPYYYKMYPGYWKEAFTPVYLEVPRGIKKILENQNTLNEDDEKRIEDLERKLQTLIDGGYVGTPRARKGVSARTRN